MSELDLYLDGALPLAKRAEFESRAAREPGIANEIALQHEIDAALRRLFAPAGQLPALGMETSTRSSALGAAIPVAAVPARPRTRFGLPRWAAWVAAAALFAALFGFAAWLFESHSMSRSDVGGVDGARWARIYAEALAPESTPPTAAACKTELIPLASTEACAMDPLASIELEPGAPAARLVPSTSGKPVAFYAFDTLTPASVVWIEHVEGNLESSRVADLSGDLHVFSRVLGPYVVYEITRGDRPLVLRSFRLSRAGPSALRESTPR